MLHVLVESPKMSKNISTFLVVEKNDSENIFEFHWDFLINHKGIPYDSHVKKLIFLNIYISVKID